MSKNLLPILPAGTSKDFKTGTWQFQKPEIDTEKCVGCGICEKSCPEKSLSINQATKKAEYNPEFCKGCGLCAEQCPKKAIKMIED